MIDPPTTTIPPEERELLTEWTTAHSFGRALGLDIQTARGKLIAYRDAGLIRVYDNGLAALKFKLDE